MSHKRHPHDRHSHDEEAPQRTPEEQAADACLSEHDAADLPIDAAQASCEKKPAAGGDQVATIENLKKELADAKDRAMRAHAELENYRKRATRELQDSLRYANMDVFRDLLPVFDNVRRAIESAENAPNAAGLLEGVKMVSQQLADALTKHHCLKIEAMHASFDPNLHQAILQQPNDEHPANTIIMVTQDGFQLHDRVVRPAQVIVSKPTEK